MSQPPRGVAYPFWERVSRERASRGMSWSELQRTTGVARSTVNNLKIQPRPPLPATVVALADALAIPVAEALVLAGVVPCPDDDLEQAQRNWAEQVRRQRDESGGAS